jgi:hypothetical protein
MSNRLHGQAPGITRSRRHRSSVEVYHEEGKAEGLDQSQGRDFQAIERHIGLVAVVCSLLRAAPHDPALRNKPQRQLKIDLRAGRLSGVGRPQLKACGVWRSSSVRAWHRGSRCAPL